MAQDAIKLVSDEPFKQQFDEAYGELLDVIENALIAEPHATLEVLGRRDDFLLGDDTDPVEDEDVDRDEWDDDVAHDLAVELLEQAGWSDIDDVLEAADNAKAERKAAAVPVEANG